MKKKAASVTEQCCEPAEKAQVPSHASQLHRVRRIRGQLDGIERMIEEQRYCPDIIVQVQAVRSALSSLESKLLEGHLHCCVRDAFESGDDRAKSQKIEEILNLVRRS